MLSVEPIGQRTFAAALARCQGFYRLPTATNAKVRAVQGVTGTTDRVSLAAQTGICCRV
jgi:hypothetical protein